VTCTRFIVFFGPHAALATKPPVDYRLTIPRYRLSMSGWNLSIPPVKTCSGFRVLTATRDEISEWRRAETTSRPTPTVASSGSSRPRHGPFVADELGPVEPNHRPGERVVVGIPAATDAGDGAGVCDALVPHTQNFKLEPLDARGACRQGALSSRVIGAGSERQNPADGLDPPTLVCARR